MWIVAYDPADQGDLLRGGLSHWLMRHGSPFHQDSDDFVPAHWISMKAIPSLRSLATSSDFILIAAPEVSSPRRHRIWTDEEMPPLDVRKALENTTVERALLSIEFTYNMDFGSNAIQRANNMIQPAVHGLPSFIVVPEAAHALRGVGRLGDGSKTQRLLQNETEGACRLLVQKNREVTLKSVSRLLDKDLDLFAGAMNMSKWKLPLLMGVIGDTWNVPGCYLPLPPTVTFFPNRWKMAGCQLSAAYALIRASMDTWTSEKRKLVHEDDEIMHLRDSAESLLAEIGVSRSTSSRNRSVDWDDWCSNAGYPPQSRADLNLRSIGGREDFNTFNHHSLLSPELTKIDVFDTSDPNSWENWVSRAAMERSGEGRVLTNYSRQKRLKSCRKRNFSSFQFDLLPEELVSRGCIATLHISDHTGRSSAPLHQNLIERTYLGRAECMDLINFRTYAGTPERPRAVVNDRGARDVVFAVDLPINSSKFNDLSRSNANIGLWYKMADIYVLEDGVFLGRLWTRGKLLRLA